MNNFTKVLLVSPLDDGKTWALMRDFGFSTGNKYSTDVINVPTGFLIDFASVPFFVQWWIPKWGKYGNAAIIHDWLYWNQQLPRKESDHVLLEAMEVMEVDLFRKTSIFWAVRLFGWWAWIRNLEDKESGYNRVLNKSELFEIKSGTRSKRIGSLKQVTRAFIKKIHERRINKN